VRYRRRAANRAAHPAASTSHRAEQAHQYELGAAYSDRHGQPFRFNPGTVSDVLWQEMGAQQMLVSQLNIDDTTAL
jgi:hypothetical protein